jgi:hypothetical protein
MLNIWECLSTTVHVQNIIIIIIIIQFCIIDVVMHHYYNVVCFVSVFFISDLFIVLCF